MVAGGQSLKNGMEEGFAILSVTFSPLWKDLFNGAGSRAVGGQTTLSLSSGDIVARETRGPLLVPRATFSGTSSRTHLALLQYPSLDTSLSVRRYTKCR